MSNNMIAFHVGVGDTSENHVTVLTQDVTGQYAAYQEPFYSHAEFPSCMNDLWVVAGRGQKLPFRYAKKIFGYIEEEQYRK